MQAHTRSFLSKGQVFGRGGPTRLSVLVVRLFSQTTAAHTDQPDASSDLSSRLSDKDLLRPQGYIGGQWRSSKDGATFDVRATFGQSSSISLESITFVESLVPCFRSSQQLSRLACGMWSIESNLEGDYH